MPSLRHLIIAALCAQQGLAGPLRRFLNSTSSSIQPAAHSAVDTTFPRPFSFPAPTKETTRMQKAGRTGTTDADGCESMTASSSTAVSRLPVIVTAKGSLGGSTPTKNGVHTNHPRPTGKHSNSTHSGNSGALGGQQKGGKKSISTTTTLTLYTTVPPSSSHAPAGSSGVARSYAASSVTGQTGSVAAGGSSAAAASSSSSATPSSSSNVNTNTTSRHAKLRSTVVTYGTLTFHYTPSSQATSSPAAIQTTPSLTVKFSFNPTSAPATTSSVPVGTTLSPLPPPAPTTTTSSSVAGITIVPVVPGATTIYVTVTTTDAGVTTTLAAETVTAYPTGWHGGGPP